jgi:NitT/TauT family transport system substrate-binding protein
MEDAVRMGDGADGRDAEKTGGAASEGGGGIINGDKQIPRRLDESELKARAVRRRKNRLAAMAVIVVVVIASVAAYVVLRPDDSGTLRVGYFPNITHSQALVGLEKGLFREHLPGTVIKTYVFNAGPSAIEAMFAGKLDITYIGPSPTINGYVQSGGQALRVVAGATSGGAVFVVRNESGINSAADLGGRKLASPQLGNTQDVALRHYLKDHGYKTKEDGGSVTVVNVANADILTLFKKGELDGAWVPEPWGARLIHEADGRLLLDERDIWPGGAFVTANIIVSTKLLQERPQMVKRFLEAHVEATIWINSNPSEAKEVVNAQLEELTGKRLDDAVLAEAFGRMNVTYDPIRSSLMTYSDWAFDLGFLGTGKPDLGGLYSLKTLNEVLKEKGLTEVG